MTCTGSAGTETCQCNDVTMPKADGSCGKLCGLCLCTWYVVWIVSLYMVLCVYCVFVHGILCVLCLYTRYYVWIVSLYMVCCVDCVFVRGNMCGLCLCT